MKPASKVQEQWLVKNTFAVSKPVSKHKRFAELFVISCFYFVIRCILLTERTAVQVAVPPPPAPPHTLGIVHFLGKKKVHLSGHINVVSLNLPTKMFATDVSRQIYFHPSKENAFATHLHVGYEHRSLIALKSINNLSIYFFEFVSSYYRFVIVYFSHIAVVVTFS